MDRHLRGGRQRVRSIGSDAAYPANSSLADTITSGMWTYDGFGRVETEFGASVDSLVYDPAGNVTERITARGESTIMTYDRMNRLVQRVVPAESWGDSTGLIRDFPYLGTSLSIPQETTTFVYDTISGSGFLLEGNNPHSRVAREYYLNGMLKKETQKIAKCGTGTHCQSTDFSMHVYEIGYVYNLDGQRLVVHHPSWLESNPTRYVYQGNGRLSKVIVPGGEEVSFGYNDDGQVITRGYPGYVTTSYGYNLDHLVSSLTVNRSYPSKSFINSTATYDYRGKRLSGEDGDYTYDGLGYIQYSDIFRDIVVDVVRTETSYRRDGIGRAFDQTVTSHNDDGESDKTTRNFYAIGRLRDKTDVWAGWNAEPDGWEADQWFAYADKSGNVFWTEGQRHVFVYDTVNAPTVNEAEKITTYREETFAYYSHDQKLRYFQVNRDTLRITTSYPAGIPEGDHGAWEQYWYDAFGRRIMARSLQDSPICDKQSWCDSHIDRFVWDGDQILWELRQGSASGDEKEPNPSDYKGTIGYVHAGGIDAPVALLRSGSGVVFPHANQRGLFATATDPSGNQVGCWPDYAYGCEDIKWPAGSGTDFLDTDPRDVPLWYGSLINNMEDGSGLLYRRNRYYDPVSGQFTQEDPIGIAGGLNLYGYAGGDPINFSDPFGLCPDENGNERPCTVYSTNADLSKLSPETRATLQEIADAADRDIGISFGVEGTHTDPRHGMGLAVDINEINGVDIGSTGKVNPDALGLVNDVFQAAVAHSGTRDVIGPTGRMRSEAYGQPKTARPLAPNSTLWRQHQSHLHVSFYALRERGR